MALKYRRICDKNGYMLSQRAADPARPAPTALKEPSPPLPAPMAPIPMQRASARDPDAPRARAALAVQRGRRYRSCAPLASFRSYLANRSALRAKRATVRDRATHRILACATHTESSDLHLRLHRPSRFLRCTHSTLAVCSVPPRLHCAALDAVCSRLLQYERWERNLLGS